VVFLGLKERGISVLYPSALCHCGSHTHNKSTFTGSRCFISESIKALEDNAAEYGISHWFRTCGIVHVVGPETESPCQSYHRLWRFAYSTHGAFGAIAFGIGTWSKCFSNPMHHAIQTKKNAH
jgi:3-isopropylmalate/(R)-2-methylmalate dehydratase large subunit